jgi:hypothetical protein
VSIYPSIISIHHSILSNYSYDVLLPLCKAKLHFFPIELKSFYEEEIKKHYYQLEKIYKDSEDLEYNCILSKDLIVTHSEILYIRNENSLPTYELLFEAMIEFINNKCKYITLVSKQACILFKCNDMFIKYFSTLKHKEEIMNKIKNKIVSMRESIIQQNLYMHNLMMYLNMINMFFIEIDGVKYYLFMCEGYLMSELEKSKTLEIVYDQPSETCFEDTVEKEIQYRDEAMTELKYFGYLNRFYQVEESELHNKNNIVDTRDEDDRDDDDNDNYDHSKFF